LRRFYGFLTAVASSWVLFSSAQLWAAEVEVARGVEPSWVKPLSVNLTAKKPKEAGDGGVWHLLADMQTDVESQTRYHHYAYRFLSESGVQESSEQSFQFDPTYQKLSIHRLRIHRDGKIIDRLQNQEIKTVARESRHEQQLYDGRLTSMVLLKDVRVGDVLEYAYSIEGVNPIFDGHFATSQQWRWGDTVHHSRYRVLWPENGRAPYRVQNSDQQPVINKTSSGQELVWEQKNSKPVYAEPGLPVDYSPYAWIEVSDFRTWDEVRQWARGLYHFPEVLPTELKQQIKRIKKLPSEEKRALAALRYVQDNIRYVGNFMGEHSHKPYKVDTIMNRRFGDCKDKTLLLVILLRQLGMQAVPALVETDFRKQIKGWLPSPFAFDHVITRLTLNGKIYWIDPTRSFQRGDSFDNIFLPDYGVALVLDESKGGLVPIESSAFQNPKIETNEVFTFEDYSGAVTLEVKTEYYGREADRMRTYFSSNSSESIKKSFLEYYANDYDGIRSNGEVAGKDHPEENRYTVTESYVIKEFWEKEDEGDDWGAYIIPRGIYDELSAPKRTDRRMPYGLAHPRKMEHSIQIVLPSKWSDANYSDEISKNAFQFSYEAVTSGNVTNLSYRYASKKNRVTAKDVPAYSKAIEDAEDLAWYYLEIPGSYRKLAAKDLSEDVNLGEGPYRPNWLAYIITVGALFFGLAVAGALYFWNPLVRPLKGQLASRGVLVGRGGWLVLLAIGVFIRPVYRWYSLSEGIGSLDLDVWEGLTTEGNELYHLLWGPTILGGVMWDIFLLPLELLQIILYIQMRTSFAKVLIAEMLILLLEGIIFGAVYQILPGVDDDTKMAWGIIFVSGVLSAAIWIPYLLISKRVRNTFVLRRGKQVAPPPLPPESV